MKRQLELRRARIEAGESSIGWKVGFGSPRAMEQLGLTAPLVGFLTDQTRLASGARVSIAGWVKPAIEPELAIYIGEELHSHDDRDKVQAAIHAIGPAIELADVDPPPSDVEEILAGNIFNRYVVLGKADRSRAGAVLDGLTARVYANDVELATITELTALTGDLIGIVHNVASLLAGVGASLQAGDVIIAGSIVPPIWVETKIDFRYDLEPVDTLSIRLEQ